MEKDNFSKFNDCDECCGTEQSSFGPLEKNNCQDKACQPLEVTAQRTDIRHARCIPILAERIYDCTNIESGGMKYIPLTFNITSDLTNYSQGDEICIKKISVAYDFIGLVNNDENPLPVIVDNISAEQDFKPTDCSPSVTCGGNILYNTYGKSVETNLNQQCCEKGRKSKIAVTDAEFYVCNLQIFVTGKIGCNCFEASTSSYSGTLANFGGLEKGLKSLDFLGNLCYPTGPSCLNMELKFQSCIGVDCVTASEKYSDITFDASALVSLFSNLRVYSTVQEELVVYTTNNRINCNDENCDKGDKC